MLASRFSTSAESSVSSSIFFWYSPLTVYSSSFTECSSSYGRVSPFVSGRHVAFGWDAVGDVHLVWDALRDELIGYMPRDDHDWHDHQSGHPPSRDEFFEGVFSTAPSRIGSLFSSWWVGLLAGLSANVERV